MFGVKLCGYIFLKMLSASLDAFCINEDISFPISVKAFSTFLITFVWLVRKYWIWSCIFS